MKDIAVLITCHNRKDKTRACLHSLYNSILPLNFDIDVYLVDDGSSDGTSAMIKKNFPEVVLIQGNGKLYWAGGMREAWNKAITAKDYYSYLLINDDVLLEIDFFEKILQTEIFSLQKTGLKGIYSCATKNAETGKITYGGNCITTNHFILKIKKVNPMEFPQYIDMANANILWISKEVVEQIGIFDCRFTHGIADYDYSLRAKGKGLPVLLAPGIGGTCVDDHGNNWKSSNATHKERITYLKSPKGLAYREYLYYIRKHFPLFLPYSFIMLWLKTLFPGIWNKFKVN